MFYTMVFLVVAAVAGSGFGYRWWQGRKPKEDPVFHLRCPKCRRRLRYRARQAGRTGMCPQCRTRITFPIPTELKLQKGRR